MNSQPQASNALKELCITITGTLPKPQETDEKDNAKRFLFHYSKTQKLGNSNVVSSVVHPLLQLVPQLHERRMKRFKVDVCNKLHACFTTLCGAAFLENSKVEGTFYSGHEMEEGQKVTFK
ncbi:hypothetical protein MC885_017276, partial [Smutsia gigantea]